MQTSKLIPVDTIVVGDRLRKTHTTTVDYIANSFEVIGQLAPVIYHRVNSVPHLLAGAHRLDAAKKLGWPHIEGKEIDLSGYSTRMAKVIVQIVEVDENLGRADLDQSERVLFMGKRFDLTEEKLQIEREEKAEAELKAAQVAKAEADAKVKALKDSEDKAAAKVAKVERAAAQATVDAAEKKVDRAKLPPVSSLASEQSGGRNATRGVADEVAKELKMKKSTVQNLVSFRNSVGDEDLKVFAGTRLGTQAEMTALVKLKKLYPDAYERIMKHNRRYRAENQPASMYSPCRELGIQVKEANALTRDKAIETADGARENFRKVAQEMQLLAAKLRSAQALLPVAERSLHPETMKIVELSQALVTRTTKRIEQKRTGAEHRYGGETEGPTRADAAKELETHADEIEKVLQQKSGKKLADNVMKNNPLAQKAVKKAAKQKAAKKPA